MREASLLQHAVAEPLADVRAEARHRNRQPARHVDAVDARREHDHGDRGALDLEELRQPARRLLRAQLAHLLEELAVLAVDHHPAEARDAHGHVALARQLRHLAAVLRRAYRRGLAAFGHRVHQVFHRPLRGDGTYLLAELGQRVEDVERHLGQQLGRVLRGVRARRLGVAFDDRLYLLDLFVVGERHAGARLLDHVVPGRAVEDGPGHVLALPEHRVRGILGRLVRLLDLYPALGQQVNAARGQRAVDARLGGQELALARPAEALALFDHQADARHIAVRALQHAELLAGHARGGGDEADGVAHVLHGHRQRLVGDLGVASARLDGATEQVPLLRIGGLLAGDLLEVVDPLPLDRGVRAHVPEQGADARHAGVGIVSGRTLVRLVNHVLRPLVAVLDKGGGGARQSQFVGERVDHRPFLGGDQGQVVVHARELCPDVAQQRGPRLAVADQIRHELLRVERSVLLHQARRELVLRLLGQRLHALLPRWRQHLVELGHAAVVEDALDQRGGVLLLGLRLVLRQLHRAHALEDAECPGHRLLERRRDAGWHLAAEDDRGQDAPGEVG